MGTFSLSFTTAWTAVGGVLTAFAAIIGALWHFMQAQIAHWKDRYTEQRKENKELRLAKDKEIEQKNKQIEDLNANPKAAAMRAIALSDAVLTEQIKKLQNEANSLQEELLEKDRQIKELRAQVHVDKERIEFIEETKLMLERKIDAYNNLVSSLMSRKEFAEQCLMAFRSDSFDAKQLKENLNEELEKTNNEIDRTSFGKAWKSAGESTSRKAERAAIEMKQKLAEIARLEAIEEGAKQKHARFEVDKKI